MRRKPLRSNAGAERKSNAAIDAVDILLNIALRYLYASSSSLRLFTATWCSCIYHPVARSRWRGEWAYTAGGTTWACRPRGGRATRSHPTVHFAYSFSFWLLSRTATLTVRAIHSHELCLRLPPTRCRGGAVSRASVNGHVDTVRPYSVLVQELALPADVTAKFWSIGALQLCFP